MKIQDRYSGQDILFEGKRTVLLKSIPVGANIKSARITVSSVNSAGKKTPSVDTISFDTLGVGTIHGQSGRFATRTQVAGTGWVEVDFHGRRTLVSVDGAELFTNSDASPPIITGASMQVDIGGGSFIEINANGAFKGPDEDHFTLDNGNLPRLTVYRVKLTSQSTSAANPSINDITIRNLPSNVSLAWGELPAFWMHPGEMVGSQTTQDFSELLQSLLLEADSENGFYKIPVILHSDTLARLDLDFDIEYQQQLNVLPQGLPEVKLPYDYNGAPQAESGLLSVSLPTNVRVLPKETRAQVIGTFNNERIAQGPIGEVGTNISVEISPQNAQAHLITIGEDVTGSAFDFLLQPVDELVRLQLDLRENLDGKPDSASLLSEPVNFMLDRKTSPEANWHNIKLPQGFRFEEFVQTRRLWLIIQSLAGQSRWTTKVASNTDVGMQHSKDGGLSWRETLVNGARMSAQYRLRNTPSQYKVPIQLQVGEGEQARAVSLERFQALGRVDFNLDFDEVAGTINQYLDDVVTKPCPEIEHLANGDFSQTYESDQDIRLPVDWELTMGNVSFGEASSVSLGNLEFEHMTGLSQIAPVVVGCDYQLEIFAVASSEGAFVEIIWVGSECSVIQVDHLPIPVRSTDTSSKPEMVVDHNNALHPRRARFKSPDDATQAEVRIKVPEDNVVDVNNISFLATREVISNTDLKDIDVVRGSVQDWEIRGEIKPSLIHQDPDFFINNSNEAVSMVQSIPVLENETFSFAFQGRSTSTVNPSIELRWRNDDGVSSLSPIVETITRDSLKLHLLEGNVPSGMNQVEVHIILLPASDLSIENVSFRQPEMVDVPLNLISQAPGELTVSEVRVAYETIEPKPLEIPETGLCSATPADSEPGDVCKQKHWCPVCQSEMQMTKIEVVRTHANRPAYISRCENCKAEIIRLGGHLDTAACVFPDRGSMVIDTRTLDGVSPGSLDSVEPPESATTDSESTSEEANTETGHDEGIDLKDINGIGTVRKSLLEQQGIVNIESLIQADPENLAKILKMSPHQARDIIHQARDIIHQARDIIHEADMKSIDNK